MALSLRQQWQQNARSCLRTRAQLGLSVVTTHQSRSGMTPAEDVVTPLTMVTPRGPQFLPKSFAQVAAMETPRVSPEASELKLRRVKGKDKRKNPLTVRLSDVEREIVRQKAVMSGCSVNAYVRASILGSDYKPPRDKEWVQALMAANLELTRQGHNLNQIARQVNGRAGTETTEGMLGVIAQSLLQTHRVVRQILSSGKEMPAL